MKILKVLILVFALHIFADAQYAVLSGTVYDMSGALIVKAKIAAIDESGKRFEAETNNDGIYRLSLPFTANPSADSKIAKFNIIVDLENRGFEKFFLKDFNFVSASPKEMFLDIALGSKNPEPCGYSGANCLTKDMVIEPQSTKISDKVLQKPLTNLRKARNNKRKNK